MDNARVMCIDDDYPILEGLKHFPWEAYGCVWAGDADNGRDAIAKLPSLRPDIALVDIVMPVMDGMDFIKAAREQIPSLHFIIITSYCDFHYARQALRYGVTEYLTKGEYTDEELGEVLQRITSNKTASPEYRYEVREAIRTIREHLSDDLTLEGLSKAVGITPNYLGSLFYQQTGLHFRDYLAHMRMEYAKELLQNTSLKIYEVAEKTGIRNVQYFSSLFQKVHGMPPGQIRR